MYIWTSFIYFSNIKTTIISFPKLSELSRITKTILYPESEVFHPHRTRQNYTSIIYKVDLVKVQHTGISINNNIPILAEMKIN